MIDAVTPWEDARPAAHAPLLPLSATRISFRHSLRLDDFNFPQVLFRIKHLLRLAVQLPGYLEMLKANVQQCEASLGRTVPTALPRTAKGDLVGSLVKAKLTVIIEARTAALYTTLVGSSG